MTSAYIGGPGGNNGGGGATQSAYLGGAGGSGGPPGGAGGLKGQGKPLAHGQSAHLAPATGTQSDYYSLTGGGGGAAPAYGSGGGGPPPPIGGTSMTLGAPRGTSNMVGVAPVPGAHSTATAVPGSQVGASTATAVAGAPRPSSMTTVAGVPSTYPAYGGAPDPNYGVAVPEPVPLAPAQGMPQPAPVAAPTAAPVAAAPQEQMQLFVVVVGGQPRKTVRPKPKSSSFW